AEIGQFGDGAVTLGPDIEGLPANNEGAVGEGQDGGEPIDDLGRKHTAVQTAPPERSIEEPTIWSGARKPLRRRSSSRDTSPLRSARSSCSRARSFSRWRSAGS